MTAPRKTKKTAPKAAPKRAAPKAAQKTAKKAAASGADKSAPTARASLIAAATRLFALYGFEGAGTRDIAREAGVNISAIAYYFSGKEGLYRAVIEDITAEMRDIVGPRLQAARTALDDGTATDARCREILHGFLSGMGRFLLSDGVSPHAARIFIREQTDPTAAFDALYAETIGPVHETVTRLVAHLARLPYPGEAATLCAHAIMGQLFGFRTHHATIMARLGWKKWNPAAAEKAIAVVLRHTDAILDARRRAAKKGGRA